MLHNIAGVVAPYGSSPIMHALLMRLKSGEQQSRKDHSDDNGFSS